MIIWISSYPKSGNTWVRSLLSSYLYTKDGIFDNFDLLKKINQFPSKEYFEFFLKDFKDIKKVSNYWIAAQARINLLNNNTTFLKTHSALCTLEKNRFTDRQNTKAVIYIVRDPRNLITSLSHHYSMSIEESYNFMVDKNKMIMRSNSIDELGIASPLGSWSDHYKSWKNLNFAPILIIRYEDLISNTKNSFIKILNFLNKLTKVKIDEKKIQNCINSCSFDKLSSKEINNGFFESATLKEKNNKKIKFFYLGKRNNWKDLLHPRISNNIKEVFDKEMNELKYI